MNSYHIMIVLWFCSQVQKASNQRPISAEPYQVLPPITPEYNDDLDPEQEQALELQEAMNDLDNFDESHQLTYRVQGKEPVDESALNLDWNPNWYLHFISVKIYSMCLYCFLTYLFSNA